MWDLKIDSFPRVTYLKSILIFWDLYYTTIEIVFQFRILACLSVFLILVNIQGSRPSLILMSLRFCLALFRLTFSVVVVVKSILSVMFILSGLDEVKEKKKKRDKHTYTYLLTTFHFYVSLGVTIFP